MNKRVRFFIVLLVLVVAGVFLYPTFDWYFLVPQEMKELAASSRVQIQAYSRNMAIGDLAELKELVVIDPDSPLPHEFFFLEKAAKGNYKLEKKKLPKSWNVSNVLGSFHGEDLVYKVLEDHYREDLLDLKERSGKILQLGLDLSGGMSILLQADVDSLEDRLGHSATTEDTNQAIDRAMEILNNRIDKFGVTEPQIRRQGQDQIVIEIPGLADPERINSFLMGKGRLNFHIVDQEMSQTVASYLVDNPQSYVTEEGKVAGADIVGAGYLVRGYYTKDQYGIDQLQRYVVITEETGLDGVHIQDAQVASDPITGRPVINFTLDREGGDIFFQLTSANEKETLAIVLDDKVKSMARISMPIRESVRMTGFERKEATDLALVLRTAAMPVDLIVNNQQAVGASLGEDSIRVGINAIALGFALVILFMLLYYRGAGLIADLALILNLVFIVAILSAFQLTLTLTSIAGLILTVGMAVDANVIIFERIKEEYRLGKSPQASIKAGFKKAFWTIMDANITTFIAAIFLSQLGSGPIQGFAYTLAVGIVSSMFTSLFLSRLIFNFTTDVLKVKKLSITWRKQ